MGSRVTPCDPTEERQGLQTVRPQENGNACSTWNAVIKGARVVKRYVSDVKMIKSKGPPSDSIERCQGWQGCTQLGAAYVNTRQLLDS
eukprot:6209906-Pleurochrysis_carterae.AAC.2